MACVATCFSHAARPLQCARLHRVYAPARTSSNRQYVHVRRNLSAPLDLLLRRGNAGCARCVAISPRNKDLIAQGRVLNMLNICLRRELVVTERRRSGATAQPTQLVDELTRRQLFIVENMFTRKGQRAHCVTNRHLYCINGKVAVTSVISTQSRRLGGRAHDFFTTIGDVCKLVFTNMSFSSRADAIRQRSSPKSQIIFAFVFS